MIPSDVSPTGAQVLRRARACPGITMADVARDVGAHRTTVEYHARRLARRGLVRIERDGHRLRLTPAGEPTPPSASVRALFALRACAAGAADIARVLGVPRGTAGSLLEALERRGLVEREGTRWRLAEAARGVLAGSASQA